MTQNDSYSRLFAIVARFFEPIPERVQENLFNMLKKQKHNPQLWFALDRIINDWAKETITSSELDISKLYEFFNTKILPVVKKNGGSATLSDTKYRTCSNTDMGNICAGDTTKFVQHEEDFRDCDDIAILFKARINIIYGINSVAIAHVPEHAWNIFISDIGVPYGIEPANGRMWPLFASGQPITYDPSRLTLFII
jgi:hypothetical protein